MSRTVMGRWSRRWPLRLVLLWVCAGLFGSCFESRVETPARASVLGPGSPPTPDWVTVVVAVDGVRWQEVFLGVDPTRARQHGVPLQDAAELLPNLHRLIQQHGCAIGSPTARHAISASGPNFVSLPGYTEMFTGAAPVRCPDNECSRVGVPTIADQLVGIEERLGSVAVITSWAPIERAASRFPRRLVVSAGRSRGTNHQVFERHPSTWRAYQSGRRAKPAPGWGDFRPDRHTALLALSYFREEQPRFLFVGLGETDEYAHHNDYRSYLQALRGADRFIGELHAALRELERHGTASLLLVTSDHGRSRFVHHGARYPESARTWLVAAGSTVLARGRVHSPEPRRLADLAPTIRSLWGLPVEDDLYDRRPGRVLSELFEAPL